MFNDIGGKIKTVAKTVCWLGIGASVVYGMLLMATGEDVTSIAGIVVMLLGSVASWVGSLMVYGFGQLIENSDILANNIEKIFVQTYYTANNTDKILEELSDEE